MWCGVAVEVQGWGLGFPVQGLGFGGVGTKRFTSRGLLGGPRYVVPTSQPLLKLIYESAKYRCPKYNWVFTQWLRRFCLPWTSRSVFARLGFRLPEAQTLNPTCWGWKV